MEIAPGVHQIEGLGFSNAFLIVGERLTLVDTGFRGERIAIEEYVRRIGRYPVEIELVVITHAHADHVGSLAALRRSYRLTVAAHEADAPYVEGQLLMPERDRGPLLRVVSRAIRSLTRTEPSPVDTCSRMGPKPDWKEAFA